MVAPNDVVVIDLTFLLKSNEQSFCGAPLIFGPQGVDNTVLYGVARDLLKLRRSVGIRHAVVVIGREANAVSNETSIDSIVRFLRRLRTVVVCDPKAAAASLCRSLSSASQWVVTQNTILFQLATGEFGVIVPDIASGALEVVTAESLKITLGIRPSRKETSPHKTTGDSASRGTRRSGGASPGYFSCLFAPNEEAAVGQRERTAGPSLRHAT